MCDASFVFFSRDKLSHIPVDLRLGLLGSWGPKGLGMKRGPGGPGDAGCSGNGKRAPAGKDFNFIFHTVFLEVISFS